MNGIVQDTLVESGMVVNSLAKTVNEGLKSFTDCPDSIKYLCSPLEEIIIKEHNLPTADKKGNRIEWYRWNLFYTPNNEKVFYKKQQFGKFVSAVAPKGLSSTIEKLQHACEKDNDAFALIDKMMKINTGENQHTLNKIEGVYNVHTLKERPTGNSKQRGIRRLRKESKTNPQAKEYLDLVLENKMTPNGALVKLGLKSYPVQINSNDAVSAARTILEKCDVDFIWNLIQELQKELPE